MEMNSLVMSKQKSRLYVQVAASLLLLAALVAPQLAWADHASDHPERESVLAGEANVAPYVALVEKYQSGELVYHAPGRRDAQVFSVSASQAYAALVEKFKNGELVFHAPGRRDDRAFSVSAGSALIAANPELIAARGYYAANVSVSTASSAAADVSSARWAGVGDSYAARFQAAADASSARYQALAGWYDQSSLSAANPELRVARAYWQTGAAFLAANPEMMISRAYFGQNGCSFASNEC
jgi:hypothetical protein